MDEQARAAIDNILAFWFSDRVKAHWFDSTPDFDTEVAERMLPLHVSAAEGHLDAWKDTARGCLALVILLDQAPRNIFRDRPETYATDALALQVSKHALSRGFDSELDQPERLMLYLPLEHSENLDDQELSVQLIEQLDREPSWADYARKHRDVIARFGRFPHRNALLGRTSTVEEAAFLAEHGTGW
ncbi:DUF924 family protein [Ferruginivarius sediminum]|uniref:DUF924 domain-containing protein n=1 Tax=Ferruginivarius sediminum TaxID=2661937 RepID=A0A369TC72_9PROT|nr:DUF924 family protein [Ferruginivarius sediminum]RDD62909.1 DUF924 domain-containing protein [Ferruginivarius sediminum]